MDSIVVDYKLQIDQFNKSVDDIEKGYIDTEKAATKASKTANDAINSQRITIQELIDDLKDLTKQRNLSTDPKAIDNYNARILENRNLVKQMTATTGGLTPVLTKTKTEFNALGNSINQLSREAPAFANSMNTGFMAISNNIPTLTDALAQLRAQNVALAAEGKPTVSILKSLAGAVFSWGTAISVGVTLLTVYGGKIAEWVGSLFEAKEATVSLADSMGKVNNAMVEEKVKADNLFDSLKNMNTSTEERHQLIDRINTQYGKYLPNLLTEASSLDEIEAAQNRVNKALERNAIMKVQEEESIKRAKELNEVMAEIRKAAGNDVNFSDWTTLASAFGILGREGVPLKARYDAAIQSIENLKKETKDLQNALGVGGAAIDFDKLRAEQEKAAAEALKTKKKTNDDSKKIQDDAAKAQDEENKRFEAGLLSQIEATENQAKEQKRLSDLKIANIQDETNKALKLEQTRYETEQYSANENKDILEQLEIQHLANVDKIMADGAKSKKEAQNQIDQDEIEADKKKKEQLKEAEKQAAQAKEDLIKQSAAAVKELGDDVFEYRIMQIQAESDAQVKALGTDKKSQAQKVKIEEETAKKIGEIKRRQAIFDKVLGLIQVAISTQIAAAKVTQQLGIGAPAVLPFIYAQGVIQALLIAAKPIPKYEKGGLIQGKRHSQGGEIIEAEDKEFVMNRRAVQKYGVDFFKQVNSLQLPKMTNYRDIAKGFDSYGGQSLKVKAELDNYRLEKISDKGNYLIEKQTRDIVKALKSNKNPRI